MALAVLGGTLRVLWSPKALRGLGISAVLAHLKKKSYCGSVTDFEMTPLFHRSSGAAENGTATGAGF